MSNKEIDAILIHEKPKRLKQILLGSAVIAVVVAGLGLYSRASAYHEQAKISAMEAIPSVALVTPSAEMQGNILVLPGTIKAFYEAPIYAQVSGYLRAWYTDIGTPVKKGQLMADIETPDLDKQLVQAKADLATAEANQTLAAVTAKRWNTLLAKDAVSEQAADDKNSDLAAKTAAMNAAQANVQRLEALENFKHIVAPFDGVVTARNTDVGSLIESGVPNQPPLFAVDDEHHLRIYVNVPQAYLAQMKPGLKAVFTVPEYPGEHFTAVLTSTAEAVNSASGALLTQFQFDNDNGMLHPGDYAQMSIALPVNTKTLSLPSSALMFRDSGMSVAVVNKENHISFAPITIKRDLGSTVEISQGLAPDDRVVNNPPDWLEKGDLVNVVKGEAD